MYWELADRRQIQSKLGVADSLRDANATEKKAGKYQQQVVPKREIAQSVGLPCHTTYIFTC